MPLRKSPVRTPALLAACRANARKSQGPQTLGGKARSSLNSLKHGRYAVHLRRKLLEAGDRRGEVLYARIEARLAEAFCSAGSPRPGPEAEKHELRRLTSLVWCFAARRRPVRPPCPKTILECALESIGCDARDLSQGPIRVQDGGRRIGLVFWRQRRRTEAPRPHSSTEPGFEEFWERFGDGFRRMVVALDQAAIRPAGIKRTDLEKMGAEQMGSGPRAGQTGPERKDAERAGAQRAGSDRTREEQIGLKGTIFERLAGLAGLGHWETGLRSRIFRLRRPNIWARLHYGLDKDGVYSPKIEARGRRELKKLCLAGIPVSSWPSVFSDSMATKCALIPYGFEEMAEQVVEKRSD